jgi:hypothetical protein
MALLLASFAGCGPAGPTQTVTRGVDMDDAKTVSVDLNMTAGELRVTGGATRLVDGSFTFNVPEWDPVVDYTRDGDRGMLAIRQGSASASFRNSKNSWDIKLNDAVLMAVSTHVAAGQGTMVLGSLNLASVLVEAGAGEFTLDLRGTPKRSYDVRVHSSVGQTNIRLPKGAAIVATATAGVGGVNVSGLEKQGSTWINPGHEQDAVIIRVEVTGGVGQIELSAQ